MTGKNRRSTMQQDRKIVIFDVQPDNIEGSRRDSQTRAWPNLDSLLAKPSEIAADQLKRSMKQFLRNIQEIIAESSQEVGEYKLDTVEVTASISAKGEIGIIGLGVGLKGHGGITFTFRRRDS